MIQLVFSLLLTPPVHAGLHLPAAVEFYRFPTAPFSSGRAARAVLESKLERTELEQVYQVTWDGKNYTLKHENLITEADCLAKAKLKENASILADPKSNATIRQIASKGTVVEVLATDDNWSFVQNGAVQGWIPQHRLEAISEDRGVYIALVDTFVRKRPDHLSGIRTTLSKGTRVKITGVSDGWLRISYDGKSYFVDSRHFVGRPDFALWAWKKSGEWVPIQHREGTFLKTRKGDLLALSAVTAFAGNPKKAIVRSSGANQPPMRAHTEVVKKEITQWGVSRLDGHGPVWWRQDRQIERDEREQGPWISTEELLKRKIYSYALVDSKKIRGLVSAQGVWKTTDGKFWRQIPEFGTQNWPVAIHSDGSWFAGAFRSRDEGDTFEPFIRWDQIAKTLENSLHRQPRYLKLQKIDPLPHSRLQILVDTGVKRVSLRTHLEGNTWQVIF